MALGKVDRQRRAAAALYTATERERFQRQLAWIARERNYAPGWIAHKFKEKFGHWPPQGYVKSLEPLPEVHAWARSA